MRLGPLALVAVGSLVALAGGSLLGASAAANTVPETRAGASDTPFLISQLAPPECAGMTLTRLVVGGSGPVGGSGLVLGTDGDDRLNGAGGDDCIVGGAGNDRLIGLGGSDVLIGGPGGSDILDGGGGSDRCYGHGYPATVLSCELFVP